MKFALIVGRDPESEKRGVVVAWIDGIEAARAAVKTMTSCGAIGCTNREIGIIKQYLDEYSFSHESIKASVIEYEEVL